MFLRNDVATKKRINLLNSILKTKAIKFHVLSITFNVDMTYSLTMWSLLLKLAEILGKTKSTKFRPIIVLLSFYHQNKRDKNKIESMDHNAYFTFV